MSASTSIFWRLTLIHTKGFNRAGQTSTKIVINSTKMNSFFSSWAPTKICWVLDNRTGPFRVCQPGGSGVHLECRVGGADLNPYLAFAALIAAGLAGIDEGLCKFIQSNTN